MCAATVSPATRPWHPNGRTWRIPGPAQWPPACCAARRRWVARTGAAWRRTTRPPPPAAAAAAAAGDRAIAPTPWARPQPRSACNGCQPRQVHVVPARGRPAGFRKAACGGKGGGGSAAHLLLQRADVQWQQQVGDILGRRGGPHGCRGALAGPTKREQHQGGAQGQLGQRQPCATLPGRSCLAVEARGAHCQLLASLLTVAATDGRLPALAGDRLAASSWQNACGSARGRGLAPQLKPFCAESSSNPQGRLRAAPGSGRRQEGVNNGGERSCPNALDGLKAPGGRACSAAPGDFTSMQLASTRGSAAACPRPSTGFCTTMSMPACAHACREHVAPVPRAAPRPPSPPARTRTYRPPTTTTQSAGQLPAFLHGSASEPSLWATNARANARTRCSAFCRAPRHGSCHGYSCTSLADEWEAHAGCCLRRPSHVDLPLEMSGCRGADCGTATQCMAAASGVAATAPPPSHGQAGAGAASAVDISSGMLEQRPAADRRLARLPHSAAAAASARWPPGSSTSISGGWRGARRGAGPGRRCAPTWALAAQRTAPSAELRPHPTSLPHQPGGSGSACKQGQGWRLRLVPGSTLFSRTARSAAVALLGAAPPSRRADPSGLCRRRPPASRLPAITAHPAGSTCVQQPSMQCYMCLLPCRQQAVQGI